MNPNFHKNYYKSITLYIKSLSTLLSENKVNSILRKVSYLEFLDKLKSEIGFLGPIRSDDLYKGSSLKPEAIQIMEALNKESPDDLLSLDKELRGNVLYEIWTAYADSMKKRQPDSVLPLLSFTKYIVYSGFPVYIFDHNDSYIIGQLREGRFRVSHFAPSSLREGVAALKELLKFDNIVIAVTEDLKPMLIKLGGLYSGIVIPTFFRGEYVQKHIIATDEATLEEMASMMSND